MVKKILFSAKKDDEIIQKVIMELKLLSNIEIISHEPTQNYFTISKMYDLFHELDFIIAKVANENSINLLYFAQLYGICTLHDLNSVLICKNKYALDLYLRKILENHSSEFKGIKLPRSWNHNPINKTAFKTWIIKHIPVVIKSHYQHDQYNRFNFLVRSEEDINYFYERYSQFIFYDVYVQEFIECDGIDRKIYMIGDEVFGIKRENPIYLFLRENPNDIDINDLKRKKYEVPDNIRKIAKILAMELKLKLFGFDLVKDKNNNYYLLDLNEFPGFKGIDNASLKLIKYFRNLVIS